MSSGPGYQDTALDNLGFTKVGLSSAPPPPFEHVAPPGRLIADLVLPSDSELVFPVAKCACRSVLWILNKC
ncbi:unnamed protein product [Zymoseptoria tritici ST99CH_1A5]|uniref:Uncharacterized protein n=1 Tax=Zymoseptoria tritici ST99CH_1A5 TaxID=1276529 RepID=A0A1Y6M2S4_ZYMTR|nr:unnamed protein product [Zymoseptoria tritici ST99CH_3D1]SMY29301.1 unnamed protein product [Zymoseptoria tritici ST99CH_1A5]